MVLDLFAHADPFQEAYSRTYAALSQLRESFHRSGRLDDSNAKLDEVSKLFATYLAFKTGQITEFPTTESRALVPALQAAFFETAKLPQYALGNSLTVFGGNPTLAIREGDESIATDLVRLVRQAVDFTFDSRADGRSFDILNEAFGHFIRDNFRSNIEDAQYMTPPEVTNFMVDLVLQDVKKDRQTANPAQPLTILDPSCGVGSFLGAIYQQARAASWLDPQALRLFGQDKVERMVRLSTLNLELFDVGQYHITIGNSLEHGSPLDDLNGSVDVILTNPPFGARFNQDYVDASCRGNTPFFSGLKYSLNSISSEQLFIDRNLSLLQEGGRMLIIVPDGVVSSRGTSALLRQHLARTCRLIAIIELPASTFAQAGTRTRTVILYLQKGRDARNSRVFMAASSGLGFQVSSRKGMQIKTIKGENDLPRVASAYSKSFDEANPGDTQVLSYDPSCVLIPEATVFKGNWTPKHYSAERIQTVATVRKHADYELVPLREMVEFCAGKRKVELWRSGCAFISILHIFGEGFLNISGALDYAPKTPGIPIQPGELLIARINPRIPRVCVTPDLGVKVLCSSEFEVMRAKTHLDVYLIAYLLQTVTVQNQIRSLTSGTSASHNRIRTSELGQVLIPVAKPGTKQAELLSSLADDYRAILNSLTSSATMLARIRQRETEVFMDIVT